MLVAAWMSFTFNKVPALRQTACEPCVLSHIIHSSHLKLISFGLCEIRCKRDLVSWTSRLAKYASVDLHYWRPTSQSPNSEKAMKKHSTYQNYNQMKFPGPSDKQHRRKNWTSFCEVRYRMTHHTPKWDQLWQWHYKLDDSCDLNYDRWRIDGQTKLSWSLCVWKWFS